MKPSQKITLVACLLSALLTGALYWLWPNFYWWVYALIWLVVAALVTNEALRVEADRKIVDRD